MHNFHTLCTVLIGTCYSHLKIHASTMLLLLTVESYEQSWSGMQWHTKFCESRSVSHTHTHTHDLIILHLSLRMKSKLIKRLIDFYLNISQRF